ncbi:MAG: recombinase family protein [Clostridia bacterium]|nr:recombinase family protein [Clostridia bacterium]
MMYGTMASAPSLAGMGLFKAGIYCRLSKDDDLQGESASIGNQRELLTSVCKVQGWDVAQVYQDDGYTGLNMDRPGLQNLLSDAKKGIINLVITKDLSRLGRNYLQTGHLIEDFFPRHGVRYIALNDNIDTMMDSNEIAPFKNVLNEFYSRDISKKVHSSYMVSAKKGLFVGTVAPFGYKKDPDQHGHLLIDEETAPAVRYIFQLAAEGHGPNFIRKKLEEAKVPTPAWWSRERGLRNLPLTRWEKIDPENGKYVWDFSVIKDLLINPVYIGAVSGQKRNYRFKLGAISEKKPEDWIVVEDRHDPIIDKATFEIVQEKLKSRQRPRQNGEFSLFAGLIKCGECGKALTHRMSCAHEPVPVYCCKTYNAFGKNHCTQHRVTEPMLKEIVLNKIRECAKAAQVDDDDVAKRLKETCETEQRQRQEVLAHAIAKDEERLDALGKMVMQLYEDRMLKHITEENFTMLMEKTQQEQAEVQERIDAAKKSLNNEAQIAYDTQQWKEAISQYTDIQELDAATLNRLVKAIVVHEQIDDDGERHITIAIHFNLQPIPEVQQLACVG